MLAQDSLNSIVEQLTRQEAELHSALQLVSMHKQNVLAAVNFLKTQNFVDKESEVLSVNSYLEPELVLNEKTENSLLSSNEIKDTAELSEIAVDKLIDVLNKEKLNYIGVDYIAKKMNADRFSVIQAVALSSGQVKLQTKNGFEHLTVNTPVESKVRSKGNNKKKGYHFSLPNNEFVNGDRNFVETCNKFLDDTGTSVFVLNDLINYLYSHDEQKSWSKKQRLRYRNLLSSNLGQSTKSSRAKYCKSRKHRRGVYNRR